MSNDESKVERRAGIDMVPVGEWFEMNSGPDDTSLMFAATASTAELPSYKRSLKS